MVLKVYISGMSGNKEVKKRQQRVLMILDSKNISYEVIDITEPGREADKEFMQNKSTSNGATVSDTEPRHALPPQIFNEEEYCGDYDAFDLANEIDTLEQFLKVAPPVDEVSSKQQENGDAKPANGEDGENKENEGEKTSEDNVVKDAEENAETKQLAKRSTLRKAAGQVVLIMKVSIKFLKNAEKPKNSEDNDVKEHDVSEEKVDATEDCSEATTSDEDNNKIKDLGNNKEVDVKVEAANKNSANEEETTEANKKQDEGAKDDVNEAEQIEKSEKDDETEQSKEAENIDGRESDNQIEEKQNNDDKVEKTENISDEKEFDQNDLKNETGKQNPEEETKDKNKEMEDERERSSENKPNEEIETVVKEDKTEKYANNVELEKDSQIAVNDNVQVEEKTEMGNNDESEKKNDNAEEKIKKEVDDEDEGPESIEQENDLGKTKVGDNEVNTNMAKDVSKEKDAVEAHAESAKTESENQESSEEEDTISRKTNKENSDDEQGESSDQSIE